MPQNSNVTIPVMGVSGGILDNANQTHTRHMSAIREEIACICNQDDQTTLNLRISSDISILQAKRSPGPYDNTNEKASKEDQEKDANTLKDTKDSESASSPAFFISLSRLEEHNSNGIVEDRFAKDDRVELWI